MATKTNDSLEERAYAKLTWRLLPFLFTCYVFAYLDRVNVGFAKLQMLNDLVDRQIERAGIDQPDLPGADHIVDRAGPRLARRLLERDDDTRLAPAHAFGQEGRGENRLATAGWPRDQY